MAQKRKLNPPLEKVDLQEVVLEIRKDGMKRWLLNQLAVAFNDARKGKLRTSDENSFEVNWIQNLIILRDAILERHYEPGSSVAFVVMDPMVREIFAAPFRDRVVHHFLYNLQAAWWDRRFIYDSHSCRVGKGTLLAIERAQKHMRQVSNNFHDDAMVVKLDIKGYFMSLPRDRLFERIQWGLSRQFAEVMDIPEGKSLYQICEFLWKQILFDDPVSKGWRRGSYGMWDESILPPEKSLFNQVPGYGIVIGNLTSQLVSNIYLDQLDRYIYYELGYKYYGRYVDDFYIMVPRKDYSRLKEDIKKIEEFLDKDLELTLHPKKRYQQSIYKGFSFVGARIYPHCIYPSNRLQSHFPRELYKLTQGEGDIDSVVSYIGMMKHMNSYQYVTKILAKFEI